MKHWVFVAALAGAIAASSAAAQQQAARPAKAVLQSGQTAAGAPSGEVSLGTVRIPRKVTADGKPLAPGTYQVRLTAEEAKPAVAGQDEKLERWAEFRQGGKVKGREVVTIVPQSDIGQVAEGRPPRAGTSKVELLKGNDYMRVWINKGGNHYLIHLPTGA